MATFAQFKAFGPYFDSSGNLYTLKIYHYIAGTTTLKDGYDQRDKGVAGTVAQPLVSDSAGIASAYWDGMYKFRIDGSTDGVNYSTIYTWDNVSVVEKSAEGEGTSIASASTITLGSDGDVFHITGSTGPITGLSGVQPRVTLIFDSTPTLTHSASLVLSTAADRSVAANDVLEFVNEGSNVWRQSERTGLIAQKTLAASTSGTSVSFTDIPAGVTRVTVILSGVSTNGTDPLLIQLGDSGGIEDTSYAGASNMVTNGAATAGATSTAGLLIQSASAANIFHGAAEFVLINRATFAWVGFGTFAISNAASNVISACTKSLSAELTQLKITTTGGTNTFDNGTINILYER
jgi:hypothetical protein